MRDRVVQEDIDKRSPTASWQVVQVTFTEASVDLVIPHRLETPDPEQITYQVQRVTAPCVIYHDGSPDRIPWGKGYVRLRCNQSPVQADILLTISAVPIQTRALPAGIFTPQPIDADTLDGLDSTAFAQEAFKTISVAGESDVEADGPTDTLTFVAGPGMIIETDPLTDEVYFESTSTPITELDDIPDVNAPTPGDGDVLTWDATPGEWVAAPAAAGASALDDLTDVDAPTPADGDVLTWVDADSEWQAVAPSGGGGGFSGAMVFLEEQVAASSATLDFDNWYSTDYDEYWIEISNLLPATDGASLYMRFSTDGGSSYDAGANYKYSTHYKGTTGAAGIISSSSANQIQVHGGAENTVGVTLVNGHMKLFNVASTTRYKGCSYLVQRMATDGNYYQEDGHGVWASTDNIDAIRFLASSGNLAEGTIRIYGILKDSSTGVSANLDDILDVDAPTPSDGDLLVYSSGTGKWEAAAPSPSSGGLVLLEQYTASSSAQLDFTTGITSAYDDYIIRIIGLQPATDATILKLQFSTNGGSSFAATNYAWFREYNALTIGWGNDSSGSDTYIKLASTISNAATAAINGTINLSHPLSTSLYKNAYGELAWTHTGSRYKMEFSGWWLDATAINAIRFQMVSGNIAAGTIRLYGVEK